MPFDAVFLTALSGELRAGAIGARVDRIHQPERDAVVLHLHGREGSSRLLLCASPNHPRVQFTGESYENPAQPPMFCMLLRKHLVGGRIVSIRQPSMERLLEFTLECTDEMGEPVCKRLVIELMGRNSNLILCGPDGRILDCLRRVDFEMSERRQVLPGLFYQEPPTQGRLDPTRTGQEQLLAMLESVETPTRLDQWLLERFAGLPPLICRELSLDFCGDTECDVTRCSRSRLAAFLAAAFRSLATGPWQPVLLLQDGKPRDFSYRPIRQYGGLCQTEIAPSFSSLLDRFYADRERADRIRQKSQTIHKAIVNLRDRTARKLENQRKELEATHGRERLRQLGDIVTANLHAIQRGQPRLTAVDFYDPEMRETDIPLSPQLSPQQNAARFYKEYSKAKNAEKVLTGLIAQGEMELEYLNSILDELNRAEGERDLADIRAELTEGGYLRRTDRKKQPRQAPSQPMEFRSTEGFPSMWAATTARTTC